MKPVQTCGDLVACSKGRDIQKELDEYMRILAETGGITHVLHTSIREWYAKNGTKVAIHINLTGADLEKETSYLQLYSIKYDSDIAEYMPKYTCRNIDDMLMDKYDKYSQNEYLNHNPDNTFFITGLVYWDGVLYSSVIRTVGIQCATYSDFDIAFSPTFLDLPEDTYSI